MSRTLSRLSRRLEELQRLGLHRTLPPPRPGGELRFDSNDYLGLARDPRVAAAAAEAAAAWGAGSTGSRLLSGDSELLRSLEAELAGLKGAEGALLFPAGYLAAAGAIPALAGPGDLILSDRLNHACLIEGCRLSRAEVRIFDHAGVEQARALLSDRNYFEGCLLVTDGLFSMDGDLAPAGSLMELAREFDALLLIDDAHATGVIGPNGAGTAALAGVRDPLLVQMGTLSKALGAQGGFIAGSGLVIETLVNCARTGIFSTALAPPAAAAAREALRLSNEEPWRRERLKSASIRLREGLRAQGWDVLPGETPIIPVMLGSADKAVAASRELAQGGVRVPAIRPPTVPEGSSRLRISLTAGLPEDAVDRCLAAFERLERPA